MRKCNDCGIILEYDVSFCPLCGRSLENSTPNDSSSSLEVAALLTSANLHRLREEWDEAAKDAARAMSLDSDNAEIASLMGAIQEQRGAPAEAAIWYQMALELDPERTADRAGLRRVAALARRSSGSFWSEHRAFLWAGAAVVLLVAILVLVMYARAKPKPELQEQVSVQQQFPEAEFERRSIEVTPPAAPPVSARQVSGQASGGGAQRTFAELHILNELTQAQTVRELRTRLSDVTADPRQSSVTVTFSVEAGSAITRTTILNTSLAVAEAAFTAHQDVNLVTARCVINGVDPPGTQIAFVGDVSREAVRALGPQPAAEQIASVFQRQWWNPNVSNR